ncbi:hypothetical protein [Peredibacter starrii]|uniref:Uncharacterized protein n=1 Tax=Peredibacter starrii TaxID=28202 RepID=A0AAX4HQF7_9BACT|nr:hypothetical protein [Peredibacter starrii]WPU65432.1 hypothetical protein SOO65_01590 [Peredibacter starrii]
MKHSTKIIIGVASLVLLYALVKQIPNTLTIENVPVLVTDSTPKKDSALPNVKADEKVSPLSKSYTCVNDGLAAVSQLTNEQFKGWIKGKAHLREWNWDNYHIVSPNGEKLVIHVVKDQDQNGNEIFVLKTFKDTDEGPVLLGEMRFYQREKLDAALEKKLENANVEILQTIDSFQFDDGSEIKRTVENGEIQDLRIASEKGVLDCQKSEGIPSCECK